MRGRILSFPKVRGKPLERRMEIWSRKIMSIPFRREFFLPCHERGGIDIKKEGFCR
jgi:hypothetical protein